MSITMITRDWGIEPCIVRMVSTDTLSQVSADGYITDQAANIEAVNNGAFEWLPSDSVLVYASDGSAFFTISSDYSSLVVYPALLDAANALTAFAGGGQANAVQLTAQINRVTVVATAADSVKLPAALAKAQVVVINAAAANAMNVYPQTGEFINDLAVDLPIFVAANKTIVFYCAVNATWNSVLTA